MRLLSDEGMACECVQGARPVPAEHAAAAGSSQDGAAEEVRQPRYAALTPTRQPCARAALHGRQTLGSTLHTELEPLNRCSKPMQDITNSPRRVLRPGKHLGKGEGRERAEEREAGKAEGSATGVRGNEQPCPCMDTLPQTAYSIAGSSG